MELIRDNFDDIRNWISTQEPKPYEAWHVMWMKRSKDGVTEHGSHVGKHWFIHNADELMKIQPSMKEHVMEGGRIVIGINRKDLRRVNAELAHTLSLRELDGNFPFASVEFPSVFDQCRPSGRGMHFIDVDREEGESDESIRNRVSEYIRCLKEEFHPKGEDKVSIVLQSKTGYHVIFDRCDYRPLLAAYNVDVKKDENTPIYIVA